MFVIPEALSLAALIFGFRAIIEWLVELGDKAMSALEHCAQLIIDITKMREWVKNIRKTYRITAVMGEDVISHLKYDLHGALDDILRACNEVQRLTDRVERSHWQTWRALVNKSKINKMVEDLKQKKQNLNQLETNMLLVQYIEEQQKVKLEEDAKCEAKRKAKAEEESEHEKAAAEADARSSGPPPPYQFPTHNQEYIKSGVDRNALGTTNRRPAQTTWAKSGTMAITGAGIGGLTTLGAVTLLAPVTGVAAVAGGTVYGLVAVASVGIGALGWARS
ncbi:hypothetical protein N431DRAFT_460975 [Stipitochalara longipes BDJ]|nr:hypothetical protein N431DRAFT_460975 [Stipitochalara longipes BDJ]